MWCCKLAIEAVLPCLRNCIAVESVWMSIKSSFILEDFFGQPLETWMEVGYVGLFILLLFVAPFGIIERRCIFEGNNVDTHGLSLKVRKVARDYSQAIDVTYKAKKQVFWFYNQTYSMVSTPIKIGSKLILMVPLLWIPTWLLVEVSLRTMQETLLLPFVHVNLGTCSITIAGL